MPLNLPMRNIDYLTGEKAVLKLRDGRTITGKGTCIVPLPLSDDTEEEEDFLRFCRNDGIEEYLLESDIKEYEILN
jgi:hypothetical protein